MDAARKSSGPGALAYIRRSPGPCPLKRGRYHKNRQTRRMCILFMQWIFVHKQVVQLTSSNALIIHEFVGISQECLGLNPYVYEITLPSY
jgi:hypothetical protein